MQFAFSSLAPQWSGERHYNSQLRGASGALGNFPRHSVGQLREDTGGCCQGPAGVAETFCVSKLLALLSEQAGFILGFRC